MHSCRLGWLLFRLARCRLRLIVQGENRSCRRGWSFVAGIAAVDSGSFAVASGGFGADSGLDSRLGSARGLLEGLELGFVVAMAVAVAVAVAAAGAAVVAETTD